MEINSASWRELEEQRPDDRNLETFAGEAEGIKGQ